MSLPKWTSAQQKDIDKAERELNTFPVVKDNGRVRVPFPYLDREGYKGGFTDEEINEAVKHDFTRREVSLASLHAIQHSVQPRYVRYYLEKDEWKKKLPDPIVVERGGTRYIYDGHHRLTAFKLLGARTAEVNYVDLDAVFAAKKADSKKSA